MKMNDVQGQLARLKRADDLGIEISESIQSWSKKNLDARVVINNDRKGWYLELLVKNDPPIDELSMLFSDAIGQLRNTLDNFAYSVLTPLAVDNTKYNPKLVKFPIVAEESKWEKASKSIKHIPEPYFSRIKNAQPFVANSFLGPNEMDGLTVLQLLSNADKHNLQIIPHLNTTEINHEIKIEFATLHDANISTPPKIEILAPVFKNGAHLVKGETKGKITSVENHVNVTSRVMIKINQDQAGITHILAGLWEYVAKLLVNIADLPPREFEKWANNLK